MTIHHAPYTNCDGCGKPIYPGNLTVGFCRSIEQFDFTPEYPAGAMTVADCYELLTLCAGCGNQFSVERATAVLQAAILQPEFGGN